MVENLPVRLGSELGLPTMGTIMLVVKVLTSYLSQALFSPILVGDGRFF
jgi:hypothetical protein